MSKRGAESLAARNLTRGTVLAGEVEVARSFWARFRGLMGRTALPAGTGLYLPGNGIHMLFMRVAIDAVFLGPAGPGGEQEVVALRSNLPPWRGIVPYVRGAVAVLELPAGTIAATGTRVGDVVVVAGEEPSRGGSVSR